jgi:hypothetical protein
MNNNIDFLMPIYVDHEDRLINLKYVLHTLNSYGFNNLIIKEYYKDFPKCKDFEVPVKYFSEELKDDNFNKMKCVNELFDISTSKYISIYDIDVIIPKKDLLESLAFLEESADIVYPYNGMFLNIPKSKLNEFKTTKKINFEDCEIANPNSYGGCVIYNRKVFEDGGKCNPTFKNVGFDDNELFIRFSRLGYNIKRTHGPLLHMEHYRSETSVENSIFLNHNMQIYNYICTLPIEKLKEEIKSWK